MNLFKKNQIQFSESYFMDPAFHMDKAQSGVLRACSLNSGSRISACLFVYPSTIYLLSMFYVPYAVLGTVDTAGKVKDKTPFPQGAYILEI